mmetsp:Transcript_3799/g.6509  ORF Transcript_3799/g.6509 Transcript_3799/m.6509 type:complete len:840 (+) Transcript_3799:199-2718(+)
MKTSFSVSRKKNTPFNKHKEIEETKKKRADEEAAKLYEEFVESFKADEENTGGIKAFVRGEIVEPGTRVGEVKKGSQKGGKYVPSFIPPGMADVMANKGKPKEDKKDLFSLPPKVDKSKPRHIDMVLEEMKREQEAREQRGRTGSGSSASFDLEDEYGMKPGSFDNGDPFTTNLYVGNICPDVDENYLKKEFVRFGPIASVKIMWPRTDEERARGRNCGFVAFMDRHAAVDAQAEMDGKVISGFDMRIGWGKCIPIPSAPIWPPPGGIPPEDALGATVPPPGNTLAPGIVPLLTSRATKGGRFSTETGPPAPAGPRPPSYDILPPSGPDVVVKVPSHSRQQHVIDVMAKYVVQDGCPFEQTIMKLERSNPDFSFLFETDSPAHLYYRWRLVSLANGDSLLVWRERPFMMVNGGPLWVPPKVPEGNASLARNTTPATASIVQLPAAATEKGAMLTDDEADEFEDLLRSLTMERADIRRGMAFALEHSNAAQDVVETLVESLTLTETPIPTKVARLYLASDILHNSSASVRNASLYRTYFESRLPEVFESLHETSRMEGVGRITLEALKKRVLAVIRAWGDWFLFPEAYLVGLQATFLHAADSGRENSELRQDLEDLPDEDIERKCRRNGLSTKNGRGAMISRIVILEDHLAAEREAKNPKPVPAPVVLEQGPRLPLPQEENPQVGVVEAKEGALAGLGLGLGYASSDDDDDADDEKTPAMVAAAPEPAHEPALPTHSLAGQKSRWTEVETSQSATPKSRWTEDDDEEEEKEHSEEPAVGPLEGGRWGGARELDAEMSDKPRSPLPQEVLTPLPNPASGESEEERQRKRKLEVSRALVPDV